MHHPTDRIAHTAAFVTPVVEHCLEREFILKCLYLLHLYSNLVIYKETHTISIIFYIYINIYIETNLRPVKETS